MRLNRTSRPTVVSALLVAFAMVVSACGGADEAAEGPTTPTADEPEDTTEDATNESPDSEEVSSFEEIEEAAREEGQLNVYTAVHDGINVPLFEAFNEAYPEIEIVHTRLITGELVSRYSSEREAGAPSADMIVVADDLMLKDRAEWFESLSPEEVPNLGDFNERFIEDHFVYFMGGPFVMTHNTDLVDEPISEWGDLLNDEYADLDIMMASPLASPAFMAVWAGFRDEYGDEFMEEIGERVTFYDSSATAQQQLAAGDGAMAGPGQAAHSLELRDAGAPLDYVTPEPVIALTHIGAISNEAENPNAAKVYLNWMLSEEGIAAACGGQYQHLAPYEDVPDCPAAPEDLRISDSELGDQWSDEIPELLGLEGG